LFRLTRNKTLLINNIIITFKMISKDIKKIFFFNILLLFLVMESENIHLYFLINYLLNIYKYMCIYNYNF